ncbi:MAG: COQ9 family protein [Pseudomonadota bacterium]
MSASNLDDLLDAALPHVAFDGWSAATLRAAAADLDLDPATVAVLCPGGALDLAAAAHRRGDRDMAAELKRRDLSALKIREKVALAVRVRLELAGDREVVRRGTTVFSLPMNAARGTRLIWDTADAIWTALGDTSEDVNWYTKRATLVGVYSATLLYWLGDDSPDQADSWAFLDRRIGDVMRIEKAKAEVKKNPVLKTLFAGPLWAMGRVRAPSKSRRTDIPGMWVPDAPET